MRRILRALAWAAAGLLLCSCAALAEGTDRSNRLIFYRVSGPGIDAGTGRNAVAPPGDMTILESEGHFALIDAGHRYEDTIQDEDGTVYDVPNVRPDGTRVSLSSQVSGLNGRDAAEYMHDVLGIDHIDFIIATHAHSDHIGGVPDIAGYVYTDASGAARHLVDEHTAYICKAYRHNSSEEDDLGDGYRDDSWHSQAFVFQADEAVRAQGAAVADVSCGRTSDDADQADFSDALRAIEAAEGVSDARFAAGDAEDVFDDCVRFRWRGMEIALYNLYRVSGALNDNVNSIAAVISAEGQRCFLAGDLDAEQRVEQRIARAVHADYGGMTLMKANHHGNPRGSNTKELLDLLRPAYIVVSRERLVRNLAGSFSAAMHYAAGIKGFTRAVYEVERSARAIAVLLEPQGPRFFDVKESGTMVEKDAEECVNDLPYEDGWYRWDVEYRASSEADYAYFMHDSAVTGWLKDDGHWYYMDEDGLMTTGWRRIEYQGEERWFYFSPDGTDDLPKGAMIIGTRVIDGKEYTFEASGALEK